MGCPSRLQARVAVLDQLDWGSDSVSRADLVDWVELVELVDPD